MASLKTEETLHHYLRRHFSRISQSRALELAGKSGGGEAEVVLDVPSPGSEEQPTALNQQR